MIYETTVWKFLREKYSLNKTRQHNVGEPKLILITDTYSTLKMF